MPGLTGPVSEQEFRGSGATRFAPPPGAGGHPQTAQRDLVKVGLPAMSRTGTLLPVSADRDLKTTVLRNEEGVPGPPSPLSNGLRDVSR